MHEMGIAKAIIKEVLKQMEGSGLTRVKSVRLKVGELTAIEPSSLVFCFESSVAETPLQGARLVIEEVPLTGRCMECITEFPIIDFQRVCPECECVEIEPVGGTELQIVSMEAA